MAPADRLAPRRPGRGCSLARSDGAEDAAAVNDDVDATGFSPFLTRACPVSVRNRRVRTRTHGGVEHMAGSLSQSRGPDWASANISGQQSRDGPLPCWL